MKRMLWLTVVAVALSGCASGYSQFYTQMQGATPDAVAASRAAPPTGNPIVERTGNGNDPALAEAYARRGYLAIGTSSFNSGRGQNEKSAVEQAKKVGADLVLIFNPEYTGTVTGSMPLTTPTTTTSYTTANATAYGAGGTVNAYGNSTTTTHGTNTTYIPYSIDRSDYGAVYFVKRKYIFGANTRNLNNEERQELESNQGVVVIVVVDNTPAFSADILAGDILLSVNGTPISNVEKFSDVIGMYAGTTAEVSFIRKGRKMVKNVPLGR